MNYYFIFFMLTYLLTADIVLPIEKTLSARKTYYPFRGKVDISVRQQDVDFIAESGVILSNAKMEKIKDKKSPEELKASMAKALSEEGNIDTLTSTVKILKADAVRLDRVILLKKQKEEKRKKPMINILYGKQNNQ